MKQETITLIVWVAFTFLIAFQLGNGLAKPPCATALDCAIYYTDLHNAGIGEL